MKKLRKLSCLIVFLTLFLTQIPMTSLPYKAEAKANTLREMKAELARLEAKLADNKKEQNSAQSGINESKQRIDQIAREKVDIEEEIESLSKEIVELNDDIIDMNGEIKDIISYYQLSSTGDSGALEYIFNADDYTELIYRMAITEQLSEYNSNAIKEYNAKISDNEKKKVSLANKKTQLGAKEIELEKYIDDQQGRLETAMEGALDLEDEIEAMRKNVKLYEVEYKCKLDETIDQCLRGRLPAGSTFYRPVISGKVSSNYGNRTFKLNGRWVSDFHYGIDIASSHYTKVYSAANGQVAAVFKRTSCGGNMIYINHVIKGKKYTTCYMHLASVNVKVGQSVTYDTVIGTMGGTKSEYWDKCSTGAHLHFSVATGNWGNTYNSYSGHISKNINPRTVLNVPALGKRFDNRSTKY